MPVIPTRIPRKFIGFEKSCPLSAIVLSNNTQIPPTISFPPSSPSETRLILDQINNAFSGYVVPISITVLSPMFVIITLAITRPTQIIPKAEANFEKTGE